MTSYFISAGWPYLYDIPGLHNCVPMLFADVHARFLRLTGNAVFYLCGGDEHGSRIEFVARGYKRQPQDLVNEKYSVTVPLLQKLQISFDRFGRTTDPQHKEFVTQFVSRLLELGKVSIKECLVPYCLTCNQYLPDRFIEGRCPYCSEPTYGGHCNNKASCGKMIESIGQGNCALCGNRYELKPRQHLTFPLSPYRQDILSQHIQDSKNGLSVKKRIEETFHTINEVTITRDSSWGITLPNSSTSNQSIYSWVDSLLGKVSFLALAGETKEQEFWKNNDTHRVFFLGLDGVPFYGVLFPSLLLAVENSYSIGNWTIIPNEVFIYEGGVCSKSTGTGIWLPEALATAEADLWRFYVFYNYAQAEKNVDFRWDKFAESINRYLIDGLEQNVTRAAHENDGEPDVARLATVRANLQDFETAKAFQILLEIITNPRLTKATLLSALPLLSCYIPQIADRASRKLTGTLDSGSSIVTDGKICAQDIQSKYQKLVDARRAQQSLSEEITNMRADLLCVCPVNLQEQ